MSSVLLQRKNMTVESGTGSVHSRLRIVKSKAGTLRNCDEVVGHHIT